MKTGIMNRNGFTFLMVVFMVMLVGILSAFTGKSWTAIVKREREKELLFRGNQIKEAIENWNNLKYTAPGIPQRTVVPPLADLGDLIKDSKLRFLPQHYGVEVEDKNPKCAPNCPKILKIFQDPLTGEQWTIIRGTLEKDKGSVTVDIGGQSGNIIGVASKSNDTPFRTNFKDTSIESLGSAGLDAVRYSDWKFIADPNNDHTKVYKSYHEGW